MTAQPPSPGVPSRESEPTEEKSISDEEWERFQRESEGPVRLAAPKEPSARARMVTERLRLEDEARAQAGRRGSKGRKGANGPARPEGWRTAPEWRESGGRAARRRRLKGLAWVVAVVALVVVVLNPSRALSWLPGGLGASSAPGIDAAPGPVLPGESARPTGAPPAADIATPSHERPFAGSPAERWDSGAGAIVLPAAKEVSGVPADRIAAAETSLREFLIASSLDRDVLYGARPERALALVDPLQPDYLADLKNSLDRPTLRNDPIWTFTRFDRDEIELVGQDIKVRGHMTVKGEAVGRASLTADYTFVYPVARTEGDGEVTRTTVRRVIEAQVVDPARWRATNGKVWVIDLNARIGNYACASGDGFIHPQFAEDLARAPRPGGTVLDPYDRSERLVPGSEGTCDVVSRV